MKGTSATTKVENVDAFDIRRALEYLRAVYKCREVTESGISMDFISFGFNLTEYQIDQDKCFVFLFFLQGITGIICGTCVNPLTLLFSPAHWQSNDTVHSLLCADIPLITNTSNHSKSISPHLLL